MAGGGDGVREEWRLTGSRSNCIDASTRPWNTLDDRLQRRDAPTDDHEGHGCGDACVRQQRSASPVKAAGDGDEPTRSAPSRCAPPYERSHARVDDTCGEKQLERVGRNPEQIEQERHRRVKTAEEAHEPCERQLWIVRKWYQRVSEPSREEHEAQREKLPRVREVEGSRDDDVGQLARVTSRAEPLQERAGWPASVPAAR